MSYAAKGARNVATARSRVKDANPDSDAAFPAPSSGGVRGTQRCDDARIEWTLLHRGDRFPQVREAGGPDEDGRYTRSMRGKAGKEHGPGEPAGVAPHEAETNPHPGPLGLGRPRLAAPWRVP